jgi:hypothetical protein
MLSFHSYLAEAMWTKVSAQQVLDALGSGFTLIGSVAKQGTSDHDLDVLRPGVHLWSGDPDPDIKRVLEGLGFNYVGQSVISPADKSGSGSRKTFGVGWNELHHFEHPTTKQRIEVWSVLPFTTAFGGA